jgi:hypothetical protein
MLEDAAKIVAFVFVLVIRDLYKAWRDHKTRKNNPDKLLNSIDLGVKINKCLSEIRVLTGANRIHILGYHNGTVGYNGVSYQYMSMLYEDVDDNTAPMINAYQSIPCGRYAELMAKIHREGSVYIPEDEDSSIGRLHRSYGICSAYKYRIGNSIANGSLTVSYHNKEHILTEEEKESIEIGLAKIEDLFVRRK